MINYTIDTPLNSSRSDVTATLLKSAILKVNPTTSLGIDSVCQAFVNAANTYNIDPLYLAAHAALESGWGTSAFARERNNLYGYQAFDSNPANAKSFPSKEYCIDFIARFVSQSYLSPAGQWYGGAPTLRAMNVHYASAATWGSSIAAICSQLQTALNSLTPPQAPPAGTVEFDQHRALEVLQNFITTTRKADGSLFGGNLEGAAIFLSVDAYRAWVSSQIVASSQPTTVLTPSPISDGLSGQASADSLGKIMALLNKLSVSLLGGKGV